MKKIILLGVLALWFSSCSDETPGVTQITKGRQWNLKIGSTSEEVYAQLQALGDKKNFDKLMLRNDDTRMYLGAMMNDLSLYHGVTLKTPRWEIDSICIAFDQGKVTRISQWKEPAFALMEWFEDETGKVPMPFSPGHLTIAGNRLKKWPEKEEGIPTMQLRDDTHGISDKLRKIGQAPEYAAYYVALLEKKLDSTYDPEMAKFEDWRFAFSRDTGKLEKGRYAVRLCFNNNKLEEIRTEYRIY